jgi:hypothetical protein
LTTTGGSWRIFIAAVYGILPRGTTRRSSRRVTRACANVPSASHDHSTGESNFVFLSAQRPKAPPAHQRGRHV